MGLAETVKNDFLEQKFIDPNTLVLTVSEYKYMCKEITELKSKVKELEDEIQDLESVLESADEHINMLYETEDV